MAVALNRSKAFSFQQQFLQIFYKYSSPITVTVLHLSKSREWYNKQALTGQTLPSSRWWGKRGGSHTRGCLLVFLHLKYRIKIWLNKSVFSVWAFWVIGWIYLCPHIISHYNIWIGWERADSASFLIMNHLNRAYKIIQIKSRGLGLHIYIY